MALLLLVITTRENWFKIESGMKAFINYIRNKDLTPSDMTIKFGSATQDGVKSKLFREAGVNIWLLTKPIVRITTPTGFHSEVDPKELKTTQEMIDAN